VVVVEASAEDTVEAESTEEAEEPLALMGKAHLPV
jgi:hypothetical protein